MVAAGPEKAGLVLGEVLRLMRLGLFDDATPARPLDANVALLELIDTARDQLVLWPVCQGLLKAYAGRPQEQAIGAVVGGLLATIDEQAARTRDQLAELSKALAGAGIVPLFLKGATFIAESGLQPQPWRPMCDLDFLVDRSELDEVIAIARSLGYESRTNRFSHIHDVHFPMLLRPPDVIGLEPHVKLSWADLPEALSLPAFQQQAQVIAPATAGGSAIRIPSDMHRLAHLVVHAQISSHFYGRNEVLLRDLLDWHHLAARESVDLEALDTVFSSVGYQPHFRSYAAFCENFWYPGTGRSGAMPWLGEYADWSQTALRHLVDPRRRGLALLRDWGRMAGRAISSPREAARMARSLVEARRREQVVNLFRGLFR